MQTEQTARLYKLERAPTRNVDAWRSYCAKYASWRNGVAEGLAEQYGLTVDETGLDYANLWRHGLGVSDAVIHGALNHLTLCMAADYVSA